MIRAILCTLALTVALTAASAHAGKFSISFGGGGNHKNVNNNWQGKQHVDYFAKKQCHSPACHAPVVHTPCYYQVCYAHPAGTFSAHEVFPSLYEAQIFAAKVQHLGYIVTVSKYDPHYTAGLPQG